MKKKTTKKYKPDLIGASLGKRPRQYAIEIFALTDIDDRRAALELVPDIYRPIVEEHLRTWFERRKHERMVRQGLVPTRRGISRIHTDEHWGPSPFTD